MFKSTPTVLTESSTTPANDSSSFLGVTSC